MPIVTPQPHALKKAARIYLQWLQNEFINPITREIPYFELDSRLRALRGCVEKLEQAPSSPHSWEDAGPQAMETAKYVLLKHRLELARDVESRKKQTHHLETRKQIESLLDPIDEVLRHDSLLRVTPAQPPRLADYLTLQALDRTKPTEFPDRIFDEKFGMLTAPGLLIPDMLSHRQACHWRGIPLSIGFIDIDDLKRLNTALSETVVDAAIMPGIMRAIDAALYGHGHAYRMGGDEYIALIPSADRELGLLLMRRLQQSLTRVKFPDVDLRVTASIGMCVVDDSCFLTEGEIVAVANEAKQQAKAAGKNRVVSVHLPYHGRPDAASFQVTHSDGAEQ